MERLCHSQSEYVIGSVLGGRLLRVDSCNRDIYRNTRGGQEEVGFVKTEPYLADPTGKQVLLMDKRKLIVQSNEGVVAFSVDLPANVTTTPRALWSPDGQFAFIIEKEGRASGDSCWDDLYGVRVLDMQLKRSSIVGLACAGVPLDSLTWLASNPSVR